MAGPPICHLCQKQFAARKSLLRHLRETKCLGHPSNKAYYRCSQCEKGFSCDHDLRRHERERHQGEKRIRKRPCRRNNPPPRDLTAVDLVHAFSPLQTEHDSNDMTVFHTGAWCASDEMDLVDVIDMVDEIDLSMPLRLPSRTGPTLKQTNATIVARAIPCGICGRKIVSQPGSQGELQRHLNEHFQMLQHCHRCEICDISFTHKSDLQTHLSSANDGNCGFLFEHKQKCTGHHPPSRTAFGSMGITSQTQVPAADDDRFDFCYRLRQWETLQIASYLRSIDAVLANASAGRNAFTEACRTSVASSPRQCRTTVTSTYTAWVDTQASVDEEVERVASFLNDDGACLRTVSSMYTGYFSLRQYSDADADALVRAVSTGNLQLVYSHIQAGADVNSFHWQGVSCIRYALKYSWPKILDLLLENGAVATRMDLCYAIENDISADIVRTIMSSGTSINCSDEPEPVCSAALHAAARSGRVDVATLLLNSGADVHHMHRVTNLSDDDDDDDDDDGIDTNQHNVPRWIDSWLADGHRTGWSPLQHTNTSGTCLRLAVMMGRLDMARLFLDHGASPDENGDSGGTLLFLAAWRKDHDMEDELRSRGASADSCLCGCQTALSTCAQVAEALVSARDSGDERQVRGVLRSPEFFSSMRNECKLLEGIIAYDKAMTRLFESCYPNERFGTRKSGHSLRLFGE